MNEFTIIFGVHQDCDVTATHLKCLRENTTGTVVPVAFDSCVATALKVPGPSDPELRRWHCDRMIYGAMGRLPKSKRYLYLEYDTLCTSSVEKAYEKVWDDDLGVVEIITPKLEPDWWFWLLKRDGFDLNDSTWGVRPMCGTFFSRSALEAIAQEQSKYKYRKLFCELRVGESARALGITPKLIQAESGKVDHYPVHPTGKGIWHPVKTV